MLSVFQQCNTHNGEYWPKTNPFWWLSVIVCFITTSNMHITVNKRKKRKCYDISIHVYDEKKYKRITPM